MSIRGADVNPPNRFIPLEYVPDPDCPPDDSPAPATKFFVDHSRSIITTNDSPDIGFTHSVNPYRGCEHGCAYCLGPETPVLYSDLTWRPIGQCRPGDALVGFDEYPTPTATRKLRHATILAVWNSRKPTYRLITASTEVTTTAEHRWLDARNGRWSRTNTLRAGRVLRHLPVAVDEGIDDDYRIGYLAGLSLGDAAYRFAPRQRSSRLGFPQAYWRMALVDDEPLNRVVEYLDCFGVQAAIRPFSEATETRKALRKVEIRSLEKLETIHPLLTIERLTRNYRRGFLAGFFDAEGHNGSSLRISQVDLAVLDRVAHYAKSFGFQFQLEPRPGRASTIRLVGRLTERMRFFFLCRPAIRRKADSLFGKEMESRAEPIQAVLAGPVRDVVDIQTTTGTFIAAGHATHNCYARPYHEYLGFSAGLDFETKIMVKEDAPDLLRREFQSPKWQPTTLSFSGITDSYQPIERTLRITRRCLDVCREFRNPVGIITKNALVVRDIDILGELAAIDAACVLLSVTSLDADLAGKLEPRTTRPHGRLAAIAKLRAAGIPVGVMAAPMIPGLTDHELPAILAAAKDAGAQFAGYTIVRLPMAVGDVFTAWLERHFPDRKEKVLNRIRGVHAGRLNDTRFKKRMAGDGELASATRKLFHLTTRRLGIDGKPPRLSTESFRRPSEQSLFDQASVEA